MFLSSLYLLAQQIYAFDSSKQRATTTTLNSKFENSFAFREKLYYPFLYYFCLFFNENKNFLLEDAETFLQKKT